MKKKPTRRSPSRRDGLKSEYRFDYAKAKPNRFASKMSGDTVAVVLDPDVAAIFKSLELPGSGRTSVRLRARSPFPHGAFP